jgi:hypothetical protein
MFKSKYFFRRFTKAELAIHLKKGKIQTYAKGEIVYLNGRVGVVLNGSALVKNHPGHNLCTPRLLFKATEGHVLGFGAGENFEGTTVDPLTWIVAHSVQTEVYWFK